MDHMKSIASKPSTMVHIRSSGKGRPDQNPQKCRESRNFFDEFRNETHTQVQTVLNAQKTSSSAFKNSRG